MRVYICIYIYVCVRYVELYARIHAARLKDLCLHKRVNFQRCTDSTGTNMFT